MCEVNAAVLPDPILPLIVPFIDVCIVLIPCSSFMESSAKAKVNVSEVSRDISSLMCSTELFPLCTQREYLTIVTGVKGDISKYA